MNRDRILELLRIAASEWLRNYPPPPDRRDDPMAGFGFLKLAEQAWLTEANR
jgi:hypothetical protein